jgi:hypothetical protein
VNKWKKRRKFFNNCTIVSTPYNAQDVDEQWRVRKREVIWNLMYECTTWKWRRKYMILSISFQVSHCVNFSLSQFFSSLRRGFERKTEQVVKEFRRSNREHFCHSLKWNSFEFFSLFFFFGCEGRKWQKKLFLVLSYQLRSRIFCLLKMKYLLVIREMKWKWNRAPWLACCWWKAGYNW